MKHFRLHDAVIYDSVPRQPNNQIKTVLKHIFPTKIFKMAAAQLRFTSNEDSRLLFMDAKGIYLRIENAYFVFNIVLNKNRKTSKGYCTKDLF